MTGKDFKTWAASIHDDAQVQMDTANTYQIWEPLDPKRIRALVCTSPVSTDKTEKETVEL